MNAKRFSNKSAAAMLMIVLLVMILALAFNNTRAQAVGGSNTLFSIVDDATGGDCTQIGNWDAAAKTCTLTSDVDVSGEVTYTIVISSDNITLDGGGHSVSISDAANQKTGVLLDGTQGVTVKNLVIRNFFNGMHLSASANNYATNNTLEDNQQMGFLIENGSHSNSVSGNTIARSGRAGIYCGGESGSNYLADNTIYAGARYGMEMRYTSNNTVYNNTIHDIALFGIYLIGSNENALAENRTSGNSTGIYASASSNGNTISGNDSSNNQEHGIAVTGNGSYSNNNNVTNNQLTGNAYSGIILAQTDSTQVSGNVATLNAGSGIRLNGLCTNAEIHDNTSTDNGDGITVYGDDNHVFSNQLRGNSNHGIFAGDANRNVISENNLLNEMAQGAYGGALCLYNSSNNTLENNVVDSSGGDGIAFVNGQFNNITNNRLLNSSENGISIDNSDSNSISQNLISNNHSGIELQDADTNNVYRNNFIDNQLFQAKSILGINAFNSDLPLGGNYWSDYDTPAEGCDDVDADGLCDAPYLFSGGEDNLPWSTSEGWVDDVRNDVPYIIRDDVTGGDCWKVGNWDAGARTCTLAYDIEASGSGAIRIEGSEITLDGSGHSVTGDDSQNSGVAIIDGVSWVMVKNLTISHFYRGINTGQSINTQLYLNVIADCGIGIDSSSTSGGIVANTLTDNIWVGIDLYAATSNVISVNTLVGNGLGINLYGSSNGNAITGNDIKDSNGPQTGDGIMIAYSSSNNTVADNNIRGNACGIQLTNDSNNNIVRDNTVRNSSREGLRVITSDDNVFYHNSFIDNFGYVNTGAGNLFNKTAPDGGNFWSDFNTPAEGCIDMNGDGFCDSPRPLFTGVQDNLPLTGSIVWCEPPNLALHRGNVYWASYQDYLAHRLSIDFSVSNNGAEADNAEIVGSIDTSGVFLDTAMPLTIGDISPGGNVSFTLGYIIPEGVRTFRTSVYAASSTPCGIRFEYPGPFPE